MCDRSERASFTNGFMRDLPHQLITALRCSRACVGFRCVVPSVGEVVPDRKRPRDPAVLAADHFAQPDLLFLQVPDVFAQRPERPTRQPSGLRRDLLAHRVDGLPAVFHHVKAVEADARPGKTLARCGDEGGRHVHGGLLHLLRLQAAPKRLLFEFREGLPVLPRGEEKQARDLGAARSARGFMPVDLKERGAVFVALGDGGFIHAEAFALFPIGLVPRLPHAAADEMPDAILADPALLANLGDGQDPGHGQEERPHQQREPAVGPCPWNGGVPDVSHRGLDARHPRLDGGAVLEEAEVLPGALHGVVDGAKLTGIGIREAAAGLEVDDEFKGSCGGIEGMEMGWKTSGMVDFVAISGHSGSVNPLHAVVQLLVPPHAMLSLA